MAHPACIVVDTLEGPQATNQGRVRRACHLGIVVRLGVGLALTLACDVIPARRRAFLVWHRVSDTQGWRQLFQQPNDCSRECKRGKPHETDKWRQEGGKEGEQPDCDAADVPFIAGM